MILDGFPNRAGRLFGRPLPRAAAAVFLLSAALSAPAGLAAGPLLIDDFGKGLSAGWEKKVFRGETVYTPVLDEGRPALKAESRATASALIYRISLDPKTYPRLSWSWKIVRTIRKGDERTKAGDDGDYRRAFGGDPPGIGAVAIMTDTDNTGEQAVAWYGAIRFLPPGP